MGTVTAMWQIALIPLLTAAPAEPPAVAEKPEVHAAGLLAPEIQRALTVPAERPWILRLLPRSAGSTATIEPRPLHFAFTDADGADVQDNAGTHQLMSNGWGRTYKGGMLLDEHANVDLRELNTDFTDVGEEEPRALIDEVVEVQPDSNIIQSCGGGGYDERLTEYVPPVEPVVNISSATVPAVAERTPPPATAEPAPAERPAVAEKPALPTITVLPRNVEAALTATSEPFWPLPYRVPDRRWIQIELYRPAATPLRMALGIAEAGELPIRLFNTDPVAALAEYLVGFVDVSLRSGPIVALGFEAAHQAARELLGQLEEAESELVRVALPPLTPPWGPFPIVPIARQYGSDAFGPIVNSSPLNLAFGPHEEQSKPITLLQPDGDEALAAYCASLPGPVWVEDSDFGPPSPLRDPARLMSETFDGMTAESELDSLFSSGEDEQLADDVSATFWQNVAGAGRTGSGQPSLAAELLSAWNEDAGAGAWSRGRRENLLDFGDDVLTAELSTEYSSWTPAGPPDLMEAIHLEQPAKMQGFPRQYSR